MPDLKSILLNRPVDLHEPNLPVDPNEPAAKINRFVGGTMGNQQPGDAASALGAMAMMLPVGKLLSSMRGMRAAEEAVPAAKAMTNVGDYALHNHIMPAEFHAVETQTPLTIEEANKMMELMQPKPELIGGPGRISTFAPERFAASSTGQNVAEQKAALDAFRRKAAEARGEK